MSALLEIHDLEARYASRVDWRGRDQEYVLALKAVSLKLERGKTLGVVGESGCGKSTLARVIMGLKEASAGTMLLDGVSLIGKRNRDQRRKYQIIFQDPQSSLNPRMKVWRIITEPLRTLAPQSNSALYRTAAELGERVGLSASQMDRYPHEFSGGQRQRIAIARALALNPALIVLDEPTSALDVSIQAQILNLLLDLQNELGLSYLLISHDLATIAHMSDDVAVMFAGEIVEHGPFQDILERPLHPFTKSLKASTPSLTEKVSIPLAAVAQQGEKIPAGDTGCAFRGRCGFVLPECAAVQYLADSDGRLVRCGRVLRGENLSLEKET